MSTAPNTYDNFFVLRGALFASRRFSYTKNTESINNYPIDNLGKTITHDEKTKYLHIP